jgi:hypothetical protein
MGFKDEPAERRIAIFKCDGCDIRESHFYDSFADSLRYMSSLTELEHDWQQIAFGPNGTESMAFHSADCLAAFLTKSLTRAYPESRAKVG